MFSLQNVRKRFEDPLTEERVWMSEYGRSFDADEVKGIVDDHAAKVERTLNCVTVVERHQRLGEDDSIVFVVIMSRNADKETFESAMEGIDYQIRDDIHDA